MSLKKIHVVCSFLVAAFICFFALNEAQAQNLTHRTSPRVMQGVRPLGMGGAFVAVEGTDENAIFYNPAAINDFEKKFHFQFLLPTTEFSYKAINFFASDLPGLADDIDAAATDRAKINVFDAFAAAHTGRYEEVGVRGNVATMMYKWVTASLYYDSQAVLALLNPASSTVDLEALTEAGLVVGSAYSFFDDVLQVGAAVKLIERHLIDETITQRDVIVNNDFGDILSLTEFGFGVGGDIGVKFSPRLSNKLWEDLKPVFGLTIQDIGHTRFFAGSPVGRKKQATSFGFALTPPKIWVFDTIFAADYRELEYRGDFITKLHLGTEFAWNDLSKILRTFSLRGGLSQGYLTGGFGLDFKYFKLNAATYGREIAVQTRQKQSRMFVVQLASGF